MPRHLMADFPFPLWGSGSPEWLRLFSCAGLYTQNRTLHCFSPFSGSFEHPGLLLCSPSGNVCVFPLIYACYLCIKSLPFPTARSAKPFWVTPGRCQTRRPGRGLPQPRFVVCCSGCRFLRLSQLRHWWRAAAATLAFLVSYSSAPSVGNILPTTKSLGKLCEKTFFFFKLRSHSH